LSDGVEISTIVLEEENKGKVKKAKEKVEEKKEVPADKKAKLEILSKSIEGIEKKYGKNSLVCLDGTNIQKFPMESTDILGLDDILGGGFGQGRVIEIYGPESSGKTTVALHAVAAIQRRGGIAAFVDAEHALDPIYAKNLGVDIDSLWISQPDSGEQALGITEDLIDSGVVNIIVIDSVAALTPQAEIEGDMGDSHIGLQARLMSQALRKLTAKLSKTKTTLIFINQLRCVDKSMMCLIDGKLSYFGDIKKNSFIYDKKVLDIYNSGKIDGIKIKSKYRPDFKISENHKQPVISNNGYEVKLAKDIKVKDWLIQPIINSNAISNNVPYFNLEDIIKNIINNLPKECRIKQLPTVLNEDLAFIMGTYYSDGSMLDFDNKSTYGIIWSEKNEERFNLIQEYTKKLFPEVSIHKEYRHINLNGKIYLDFFKALGLKRYGKFKDVPKLIYESRKSVIISFIRGCFFDTHHFYTPKNNGSQFIFTNENKDSLIQISNILYYLGIFSDIRGNYLYISGCDAVKFSKDIGFAEPTKQKISESFIKNINARGKYDVVPYSLGYLIVQDMKKLNKNITDFYDYKKFNMCLYKKLNFDRIAMIEFLKYMEDTKYINLISSNRFTEIKELENIVIDAIDIEVENDSLFTVEQYLTHNCKIGVMFGSPEVTSGGNALKFYSSQRLDVRKIETIGGGKNDDDDATANKIKIKIVKNKLAPPFRKREFLLEFGKGINKYADLLSLAVDKGVIDKKGAWYTYGEEKVGQGADNSIKWIQNLDKDQYQELYNKVKNLM